VFEAPLEITTGNVGSVTYVTNEGQGTVGPKSSATVLVQQGGNVTLVASPSSFFYTFTGWSGDSSSDVPRLTLTMDSFTEVSANFSLNYAIVLALVGLWVIAVPVVAFLLMKRRARLRHFLRLGPKTVQGRTE